MQMAQCCVAATSLLPEPREDYLPVIKTGDSLLPLKGLIPCSSLIWLASTGNGAATTKAFASSIGLAIVNWPTSASPAATFRAWPGIARSANRLRGSLLTAPAPPAGAFVCGEHDPDKACPGLDPGWEPAFGQDRAQHLYGAFS